MDKFFNNKEVIKVGGMTLDDDFNPFSGRVEI